MATITVRDLPDDVQRRLKERAAANDRSMEAEARRPDILSAAVPALRGFGAAWLRLERQNLQVATPLPLRSRSHVILTSRDCPGYQRFYPSRSRQTAYQVDARLDRSSGRDHTTAVTVGGIARPVSSIVCGDGDAKRARRHRARRRVSGKCSCPSMGRGRHGFAEMPRSGATTAGSLLNVGDGMIAAISSSRSLSGWLPDAKDFGRAWGFDWWTRGLLRLKGEVHRRTGFRPDVPELAPGVLARPLPDGSGPRRSRRR